jgi:hypothetical protein
LDLVATQLHGKDLTDIWDIPNPMKVTRDYKVELLLKLRIVQIGTTVDDGTVQELGIDVMNCKIKLSVAEYAVPCRADLAAI